MIRTDTHAFYEPLREDIQQHFTIKCNNRHRLFIKALYQNEQVYFIAQSDVMIVCYRKLVWNLNHCPPLHLSK